MLFPLGGSRSYDLSRRRRAWNIFLRGPPASEASGKGGPRLCSGFVLLCVRS